MAPRETVLAEWQQQVRASCRHSTARCLDGIAAVARDIAWPYAREVTAARQYYAAHPAALCRQLGLELPGL